MLIDVGIDLLLAGDALRHRKRLEYRAGIVAAAAEVVDLTRTRRLGERGDETGDIERVDVVAHLLALVAEHGVRTRLDVALDQVRQEAVQLNPGVIRSGQTAAAQA